MALTFRRTGHEPGGGDTGEEKGVEVSGPLYLPPRGAHSRPHDGQGVTTDVVELDIMFGPHPLVGGNGDDQMGVLGRHPAEFDKSADVIVDVLEDVGGQEEVEG